MIYAEEKLYTGVNVGVGSDLFSAQSKAAVDEARLYEQIRPDIDQASPLEKLGRGARLEFIPWSIGSALKFEQNLNTPSVEGYNFEDEIEDTVYEPYSYLFKDSTSPEQTWYIKQKINQQLADRYAQSSSMSGWVGGFVGSLLNPTTLLPGAQIIKSTKGAKSLYSGLKSTTASSLILGGTVAGEELILQATQPLRTKEESYAAIVFSSILGGAIGGGSAVYKNKKMYEKTLADVQDQFVEKLYNFNKHPFDVYNSVKGKIDDVATSRVNADVKSAGAKAVTQEERIKILEDVIAKNEMAQAFGLAKMSKSIRLSPLVESLLSPSVKETELLERIIENPLITNKNKMDVSTPVAAETELRTVFSESIDKALKAQKSAYKEYRKSVKSAGGKPLSQKDFSTLVTAAGANGDKFYPVAGNIPERSTAAFVEKAAKGQREFYDYLKKKGIQYKLDGFTDDMQSAFDESHIHRLWSKTKIILERPKFKEMLTDDFEKFVQQKIDSVGQKLNKRRASIAKNQSTLDDKIKGYQDKIEGSKIAKDDLRAQIKKIKEEKFSSMVTFLEDTLDPDEILELINSLEIYDSLRGVKPPMSLVQAIRKLGGINRSDEFIGDLIFNDVDKRYRGLINKSGVKLDDALLRLKEQGWYDDTADLNDLLDDIVSESNGNPFYRDKDVNDLALIEARSDAAEIIDNYGFSIDEFLKLTRENNTEKLKLLKDELKQRRADFSARKKKYYESLIKKAEQKKKQLNAKADFYEKAARKSLNALYADEGARSFAETIAEAITQKMTSDINMTPAEALKGVIPSERGFLQARTLPLKTLKYLDFIETDTDVILRAMMRRSLPDMILKGRFGSVDLKDQLQEVIDEYDGYIDAAQTSKEKINLEKQKQDSLRRLTAYRDMFRGTYGQAAQDPESILVRSAQQLRLYNYLRLMGGFVISSLPDVMRPSMETGFLRSGGTLINGGISLVKGIKPGAIQELRSAGIGFENRLFNRLMDLSDLGDTTMPGTPFEKFMNNLSQHFSNWNGANLWTNLMKTYSGMVTYNTIVNTALSGKLKRGDKVFFSNMGLGKLERDQIAEQLRLHMEVKDGQIIANSDKWPEDIKLKFRAAINKQSSIDIVTPGIGDRPLIMQNNEMIKVLTQFQAFTFAAHNRVLMRGVQRSTANIYFGMLSQIFIGMLVAQIKMAQNGKSTENWDERKWIQEGLDRSGIMALMMMASNTAESLFQPLPTMMDLFGGGPTTRYSATRGAVGAIAGPSLGIIENVVDISRFDENPEKASRSFINLLPGQNIPYLKYFIFDPIEEALAE